MVFGGARALLGNEKDLPYLRVRITGNLAMGGMWNGIAVGTSVEPIVEDNYVQGRSDNWSDDKSQVLAPWIIVQSKGGSLKNNFATGFITKDASGLAQSHNVTIKNAGRRGDGAAHAVPGPARSLRRLATGIHRERRSRGEGHRRSLAAQFGLCLAQIRAMSRQFFPPVELSRPQPCGLYVQ